MKKVKVTKVKNPTSTGSMPPVHMMPPGRTGAFVGPGLNVSPAKSYKKGKGG